MIGHHWLTLLLVIHKKNLYASRSIEEPFQLIKNVKKN